MKIWAFLVSKEQPLRWLWGVARSGYHDTFYPCLTFWAPFNQKNLFVLKISMKCDNLPRSGSCGWLESSGGRQLGLWGQQSHHLGRETWSWSHPRGWVGGGDVFKPKTKIVNTKAKSKNKSHHLGARLGLCSGQEEVGEGGSTQEDESKPKNFWSSTRPRPWVQQDQD